MEYVKEGDLGRQIAENGPLSEPATKIMAKQLLDALGYLHGMSITHRDVKPDNILVDSLEPFVVKLTDFGLSKMIENEQTFLRTFCGTLLYCAPEVYSEYPEYDERGRRHPRNRRLRQATGARYHNAVDIWSLGGVLFYALTKKPPFPARNVASHSELLHQIMTKPLDITPLLEAGVAEEGIDFLRRMLDRRPDTRATVQELQSHPWITDPGTPVALQSFDEVTDEELLVNASQLSLEDQGRDQLERQDLLATSDDEILDEEEAEVDGDNFPGYESEKENGTFGPGNHQRRLFGEVNASAVGSAGAIPVNRLNLPVSAASFGSTGTTEILGSGTEIRDSFESEDSLTPRQKSQKSQPASGGLRASVLSVSQSTSVDELNNMTFDVASQSLGGAESILEHLNMKSRGGSLLRSHTAGDLTSSKRKPSSDSSEEDEMPVAEDRRGLKRLRSEGSAYLAVDKAIEDGEYELLAQIPSISRAQSGRQIDNPVYKSTYWSAQDRKTWHLNYPEMTQLQLDAFKMASTARDEDFGPGKTPLWSLAVKYFPAIERAGDATNGSPNGSAEDLFLPSTARADASLAYSLPDTQVTEPPLTMPLLSDPGRPVVACLQSAPGSAVPGISVMMTESMVSWGRAPENTRTYPRKSEGKVPKYAFRILLWKQDYDPARKYRPWNRPPEPNEESFYFYISTKATSGIYINNVHLPSDDCKNPTSPSRYWMTLHDGDRVSIWQTADRSSMTELIFRCGWGGSAQPRPTRGPSSRPSFASDDIADRLDDVCVRTEKKMRSLSEHDDKLEAAHHDVDERMRTIDRERQRSRDFELKRLEACRALGIRRVSPAPGITLGESSATQNPWSSYMPNNRTVPTFRHASPNTAEFLLRAARRG
jgi:serine/threonine protein kinase